jgi:hypothetical protein
MKNILLIAFLFLTGIFGSIAQVPNGSFENWISYSGTSIIGFPFSGEYPTGWQTSDSLFQYVSAPHSAVREGTDKCDQLFSIKLTSVTALGTTGPGTATNGVVESPTLIDKGTPDTTRYQELSGCYKYTPSGSDHGIISAYLLKWNTSTSLRDTVATAILTTNATTGVTNFQTDFIYREIYKPDTMLIILLSSPGIGNAVDGSTLIVDKVALSGWVGINEANSQIKSVRLFPFPASSQLTVDVDLAHAIRMNYEIMDIAGKKITTDKMQSTTQKIDVSQLAPGNYFITLRDDNGKQLYSGKFSVAR